MMWNLDSSEYQNGFVVKGGLESLFRRLEKGMHLKGRIIDKFDKSRYLLRIMGYNILTESAKEFDKYEEVDLVVLEVMPHLVLDIFKAKNPASNANDSLDILVE